MTAFPSISARRERDSSQNADLAVEVEVRPEVERRGVVVDRRGLEGDVRIIAHGNASRGFTSVHLLPRPKGATAPLGGEAVHPTSDERSQEPPRDGAGDLESCGRLEVRVRVDRSLPFTGDASLQVWQAVSFVPGEDHGMVETR